MLDPQLLPRFMLLAHAIMTAGLAAWYLGAIPHGKTERRFRPTGYYMMITMVACLMGWLAAFDPRAARILPWVNISATIGATAMAVWATAVALHSKQSAATWPWRLRIGLGTHWLVTFVAPRLFEITNRPVPQLWLTLVAAAVLLWLVFSQIGRLRRKGHYLHWSLVVGVLGCLGLGWMLVLEVNKQGWLRTEDDLVRQATALSRALGPLPPSDQTDPALRYKSALESVCRSSPVIAGAFVLHTDGATSSFLSTTFDPDKSPAPRLRSPHLYARSLSLADASVDIFREPRGEKWITVMAPLAASANHQGVGAVGFVASSSLIEADLASTMLATESILLLVALVVYVCVAGYLHGLERVWQRDALLETSATVAQRLLHATEPREIAAWLASHLHEQLHLVHASFLLRTPRNQTTGYQVLTAQPHLETSSFWYPHDALETKWRTTWEKGQRLEGNLSEFGDPLPDFLPAYSGSPWVISDTVVFRGETWGVLTLIFPEGSRALRSEVRAILRSITTAFAFCLARQERADHLAAAEERLRTIIETTPDGFWDIDFANDRHYRSPQWWQILGYEPPVEGMGRSYTDYIEANDLKELQADHQEKLPPGRRFRRRLYRARHFDGTWRWIETNAVEIRPHHGAAERAIGFDRDVTERTQYEERLRGAAETAARANKAKSEFLATMSHELRTPLNSVIGFASILDRSTLDATQREWVSSMRTSAEQLLGLISDVLDFSRIEAGKLELESAPFELRRAAEQALEHFSRQATDKHLALHLHFAPESRPTWVNGDVLRLRQIITNLVGNAVKFTEQGNVILRVSPKEEDQWEFAVIDTGPGIEPGMIPHLFDRFKQLDPSTTRKHGGTGLGLAISRQLAHSMQGDIEVQSTPGEGSTFTLSVVLPQVSGKTRRFTDHNMKIGRPLAVLHPDANDLATLESSLFKIGCEITSFNQVSTLLEHIKGSSESVCVLFPQAFRPAIMETARQLRKMLGAHTPPVQFIGLQPVPTGPTQPSPFDMEIAAPLRRRELITAIGHQAIPTASPFEGTGDSARTKEQPGLDPNPTPLRVLVAEDHPVNREVIGTMLKQLKVSADYAENGEIAIEQLSCQNYDLALIDIQMPVVDGYGVIKWVRSSWHDQWPRPRMVAVTANATREDRQKCLDAGMDDFMPKPITFTTLADLINDLHPRGVFNSLHPFVMTTDHDSNPAGNKTSLPGDLLIDWVSFESILGFTNAHEEPEVLRRILATYEKDCGDILDQVTAMSPDQHAEARKLLHKLKGSSGSLAFAGAITTIRKLHDPMESPPAEERTALLERIRLETAQCIEAVRNRYPILNADPA